LLKYRELQAEKVKYPQEELYSIKGELKKRDEIQRRCSAQRPNSISSLQPGRCDHPELFQTLSAEKEAKELKPACTMKFQALCITGLSLLVWDRTPPAMGS